MRSTVLFVGAHADDVELGAGGTCAYLSARGFDVHILVISDDDCQAVAAQRRLEAVAAGAELGVTSGNIHFLGLPDGGVTCNREAVSALRRLVSTLGVNPIAVFTHTEADSHQDHVATTRIVEASFRKVALFKYQVRNSVIASGFVPAIHCAIDQTQVAKLRALKQHASQVAAGRIQIDDVIRFDERSAKNSGGRFGEGFELDLQEGAAGLAEPMRLIGLLDSQPFRQLWSPVIATGGLTVMAASERRAGVSAASDLALVTRLQDRLLQSRLSNIGVQHRFRFDVALSDGPADAARVAAGNTLILGGPDVNPAASALQLWLGVPLQTQSDAQGLLTIACNPLMVRRDGSAFIFCASGRDDIAVAAAAEYLLDDGRIKSILERARNVYSGRTPWVQIPVPVRQTHERTTCSSAVMGGSPWANVEPHDQFDRHSLA